MANIHLVIHQIYTELLLHAQCCVKPRGLYQGIRQTRTLFLLNPQADELTISNSKIITLITIKNAMHDKDTKPHSRVMERVFIVFERAHFPEVSHWQALFFENLQLA